MAVGAAMIVLAMNLNHRGYERYWWWDNVGHFLSGFTVGLVAPHGYEKHTYLTLVPLWEAFEWKLATMKLYELHDSIPEGPRSLGYEGWCFDHQVEDTILDTIMGYYGVRLARLLKR